VAQAFLPVPGARSDSFNKTEHPVFATNSPLPYLKQLQKKAATKVAFRISLGNLRFV